MKTTQDLQVLQHLKNSKYLTAYTAVHRYGIYRLSAVIKRLRESGNKILSEQIPEVPYNCVRYSLDKSQIKN